MTVVIEEVPLPPDPTLVANVSRRQRKIEPYLCECGCGQQTNELAVLASEMIRAEGLTHRQVAERVGKTREYISALVKKPPVRWVKGHWVKAQQGEIKDCASCGRPFKSWGKQFCARRSCEDVLFQEQKQKWDRWDAAVEARQLERLRKREKYQKQVQLRRAFFRHAAVMGRAIHNYEQAAREIADGQPSPLQEEIQQQLFDHRNGGSVPNRPWLWLLSTPMGFKDQDGEAYTLEALLAEREWDRYVPPQEPLDPEKDLSFMYFEFLENPELIEDFNDVWHRARERSRRQDERYWYMAERLALTYKQTLQLTYYVESIERNRPIADVNMMAVLMDTSPEYGRRLNHAPGGGKKKQHVRRGFSKGHGSQKPRTERDDWESDHKQLQKQGVMPYRRS